MLEDLLIMYIYIAFFAVVALIAFILLCIIDYIVILKYNKKSLIKKLFNDEEV